MNRQFLILFAPRGGHTHVDITTGLTLREALCHYLAARDASLSCLAGGSVCREITRGEASYFHPLALIEMEYKPLGEWQVRELTQGSWNTPGSEPALVGEDPSDVAVHLRRARMELQREFPRSQLRGFVWYLQAGVLVTFYRRAGRSRIEVVRRYLHQPGTSLEPWAGDYEELLESLWLGPSFPAGRPAETPVLDNVQ